MVAYLAVKDAWEKTMGYYQRMGLSLALLLHDLDDFENNIFLRIVRIRVLIEICDSWNYALDYFVL